MTDLNIIHSDLSKDVIEYGNPLRVDIYRLETDSEWCLEVINADGTSTVWDDQFSSDEAAFAEFQRTIRKEGVSVLLGK